jgi:hypothetical protein
VKKVVLVTNGLVTISYSFTPLSTYTSERKYDFEFEFFPELAFTELILLELLVDI